MSPALISWDAKVAAIGGKKSKQVAELGLATVGDLLGHYPRRYVRKGDLDDPGTLVVGAFITVFGRVLSSEQRTWLDRRTRRTAYRLEVVVDTGRSRLALTFFDRNRNTADWRAEQLRPGVFGLFSGRLSTFRDKWQLTNPHTTTYGAADSHDDALATVPDLIPIYAASAKVQSWELQEAVRLALDVVDRLPDPLPEAVRAELDLLDVRTAYTWIHRPEDFGQITRARRRLKYDEAFVTQVALARRRAALDELAARPRAGGSGDLLARFDGRLPFELTGGQQRVGEEILDELARPRPMHRLLQGDVGSGKTIVALRAMLRVVDSGGQAALLAPTEVLAQQHHRSIAQLLGDLGEGGRLGAAAGATRVVLLTGSSGAAARKEALLDAQSGEAGIVIGTHALLEEHVRFYDLGLVVVDEQHRFGVEQRAALTEKAEQPPHLLVMTATPIPRTVAMTVFGDLDTSVLDELPAGRQEVQTTVVPVRDQPAWVDRAWARIREEVDTGRQAYVVCPRIGDDEPDDGPGAGAEEDSLPLHAVVEQTETLAAGPLAGLRVDMLHGRMRPDDKDAVMRRFAAGETDVLVSTTVIEVGVDVPNATVMVILDADRFGVSQLHQLRGRIGRGGHAGLCLLVTAARSDASAMERLRAVAATRDGFELSRVDLAQRREGDVLGTDQSGRSNSLALLSVVDDEDVIVDARRTATAYAAADPELAGAPDLAAAVRELELSAQADFLDMT